MATYHTETKDKLSKSLWRLLESNTLERITITMICQEAGIGRRSFYRHFKSKWNVIEYEVKQKSDEFATLCTESRTMEELIEMSFRFFKRQKKLLSLLEQNDLMSVLYSFMQSSLFESKLNIYMRRSGIPMYMREYVANAIAATHISLIMTWVNRNFREDWREFARFELSMFSVMK